MNRIIYAMAKGVPTEIHRIETLNTEEYYIHLEIFKEECERQKEEIDKIKRMK